MTNYNTVAYYTLGCKLNFSETSTISRELSNNGFAKTDFENGADLYVINTCSVTNNANRKCREIIRKALNYNPKADIIVVGCYAQLKPQEIANIKGVKAVLGANEKFNVKNYIEEIGDDVIIKNEHIKETKTFVPSYSKNERTRAFFKIQDGCDYFCSFCTIPLARGISRSGDIQSTILELKKLENTEIQEVVFTGVNIGDFGKNNDETFFQLISEIEKKIDIPRFRISSIEPNLITNEIIEFVSKSNKFSQHFHIPLQSGSDKILKLMRRRYDTALYKEKIEFIYSKIPNVCIGVDVIVGFPSETDEDFEQTYNFLLELPISYLHVFSYSQRDNTTAVRISPKVDSNTIEQRSKRLRILSLKKQREFYNSNIGKIQNVIFEYNSIDEDYMTGFTSNYIKVISNQNPFLKNYPTNVSLKKINPDGLMEIEFVEKQTESNLKTEQQII